MSFPGKPFKRSCLIRNDRQLVSWMANDQGRNLNQKRGIDRTPLSTNLKKRNQATHCTS